MTFLCKAIRQQAPEPSVCPTYIAEFMFAPRDLPTLVSVPSHLVTGAHAQQAAQLCPQVPCLVSAGPLVPCSLSVHRAVCPCVSSTGVVLAVHTMVCPWIPHVFSVSASAPSMPCVLPIPFSRRGPSKNVTGQIPTFRTIKTSSSAFHGPRPLAGPAPLCPPDY